MIPTETIKTLEAAKKVVKLATSITKKVEREEITVLQVAWSRSLPHRNATCGSTTILAHSSII